MRRRGLQFPALTAEGIGAGLRLLDAALLWPPRLIRGRRASVWRALVVLPLRPAVGMPVLAAELIRDRLQQVATAERLEREVTAVSVLEQLRAARSTDEVDKAEPALAHQIASGEPGIPAVSFSPGPMPWSRSSP